MGFTQKLSETFDFDESEYARRISNENEYPTLKLKTHEVAKCRQHVSAGASIGGGIGAAPFTLGLSLLGSAYGARRLYIAEKKLEIIREELVRRDVSLHKFSKRDFFIPMGVSVATLGFGAGLDVFAAHATSQVATHVVADHGSRAVSDIVQSPGGFVHSVEAGASLQLHEIAHALTGHATANLDSYYIVAGAPYTTAVALVGTGIGMSAAQVAEKHLADWAAGRIAYRHVDRLLPKRSQAVTTASPPANCRRILSPPSSLRCEHCADLIDTSNETYYHCCQCGPDQADDYDTCEHCFTKLNQSCSKRDRHVLFRISPSSATDACCRRLAADFTCWKTATLVCSSCKGCISEGDYYHCCLCSNDDFDLCKGCFTKGERCLDGAHKTLQMMPEPRRHYRELTTTYVPSSCARYGRDRQIPLSCNACERVFQPAEMSYLRMPRTILLTYAQMTDCCSCNDDYDLCMACVLEGLRCCNAAHVMKLFP
ncbi:hypothetical protein EDD37DRAFT_611490 [Exophiala viscosa]|uniref:uncharacterized protein n=1 Tax=Exophiala viscosa TaxID=2486360 RepID=UPI00218CF362|nr:hypothetical protein EDD37DRAFT_611490 [Exophiala viscosa]